MSQQAENSSTNHVSGSHVWWRKKRNELLTIMNEQSIHEALYVYDSNQLTENANSLLSISKNNNGPIDTIFYAMKANPNKEIVQLLEKLGLGLECVSIEEIKYLLNIFPTINLNRILFTPNFAPKREYGEAFQLGITNVTIDSLYPLENWKELLRDKSILLRIDPGIGKGHHAKVKTAGIQSKFGIYIDDVKKALELAEELNVKIIGLHAHVGSGILDEIDAWKKTANILYHLVNDNEKLKKEVKLIDCGGGLGVPYIPFKHQRLDIKKLEETMKEFLNENLNFGEIKLCLEPGRYLTANAGVLLARVTQIKSKGDKYFVGIETGMNTLIRPSLYDAHHEIVNLSKIKDDNNNDEFLYDEKEGTIIADIVGPICESGDVFGKDRILPKSTREGDVLCICTTGSYGASMSSYYNNRKPAKEIII
ncbi:hypothetical protein ABK040_008617 [Willaertia magna]